MTRTAPSKHVVGEWIRTLRLKPGEKLVLMLVYDRAGVDDEDRWTAFPGCSTLAEESGFTPNSVRNILARLEDQGVIEREHRRRRNGSRTSNRIVLLVPGATALPDALASASQDERSSESAVDKRIPECAASASPNADQNHQKNHQKSSDPDGSEDARATTDPVGWLFNYWRETCGHQHARATSDRLAKIRARLRDGYTVDEIQAAIDGAARGAFVSDTGRRFDDIALICRNGEKLDSFITRSTAPTRHAQVGPTQPPAPAGSTPALKLEQAKPGLRAAIGESDFDIWLGEARAVAIDPDGTFVLGVPAELAAWVGDRFIRVLEVELGPTRVVQLPPPEAQAA